MVAGRAREQWLPSIGMGKGACRLEGLRPAGVPLRFLLSRLLMPMKKNATDRFVRDSIGGCYGAQRFLLLHHTMHDQRPVFSGNTISLRYSLPCGARKSLSVGSGSFIYSSMAAIQENLLYYYFRPDILLHTQEGRAFLFIICLC